MRTDVKLGVVISLGVVLLAGGYYVMRDRREKPIEVTDGSLAEAAQQTEGSADAGDSAKERRETPTRSARRPARTSRPESTDNRTESAESRTANREPTASTETTTDPARSVPESAGTQTAERGTQDESDPNQVSHTGQSALDRRMAAARRRANRLAQNNESQESAQEESAARTPPERVDRPTPTANTSTVEKEPDIKMVDARTGDAAGTDAGRRSAPERITPDSRAEDEARRASTSSAGEQGRAAVETHRVQPGDTFASLAKMYYGDEKYTTFLSAANQSIDPRSLTVGTEVQIPPMPRGDAAGETRERVATRDVPARRTSDTSSASVGNRTYTVRAGDTFYGIARDELKDASRWRELFELNKTLVKGDATRLQVGQVISLPSQ